MVASPRMATVDLPRVDPDRPQSALARAYAAFGRTRTGRWVAINVAAPLDRPLMRYSRGRIGFGLMLPWAELTTRGAKSGADRTAAILYFHDAEDVIVIASSFGRDKHPAWYHNLRSHPECGLQRRGGGGRYVAEEVTDEAERDRLWAQGDKIYPGYADYRARVRAIGRKIPILRLRRT
ncbi:MAG: hypothetical protein JWN32_860 [Solirubrobacterales bacterium]|nr:hypothetical protein [Solirubrobacterales bacterium]